MAYFNQNSMNGEVEMRFNEATIRILVRKDFGACFDFYTKKIGLVLVYGDEKGPHTSFAVKKGEKPCFAIFAGANMSMYKGYEQPNGTMQPDTIVAVIPSDNIDEDYKRLKEAGVNFLGEPQTVEDWGFRMVYFRDPEDNLFELMSGDV